MVMPVVSMAALEMWAALGPWADADGDDTDWALLKFCEAVAKPLQTIIDNARDQEDGTPGWAVVMSADTAPVSWLPWLGQFVGVQIDQHMSEADQRGQVKAEQSWQRGTIGYLIKQAQRFLVGTKTVLVTERDTSPYHFTVQFFTDETAGYHYSDVDITYSTYSDLDSAFPTYHDWQFSIHPIIDALIASKPAGLVMNIVPITGHPSDYTASQWYVWSTILGTEPALVEHPTTRAAALVDFTNA